jgi:hypothetical protein
VSKNDENTFALASKFSEAIANQLAADLLTLTAGQNRQGS